MSYRNTVEFQVSGTYAMFSDPVTRAGGEHFSMHVPTYESLKGIMHSVYFKPTIVWIIDAVRIMKPIQTETKGIRPVNYNGGNDLANYTYLKDVEYQVRAHFQWNENRPELSADWIEHKHHNIAKRMIARGGRRDVFLGTRECQGYVEPCVFGEGEGAYDAQEGEISYGFTYHGITYADEAILAEDKGKMTVRFWKPVMKKGIIEFLRPEACVDKRHIREMEIKRFGIDQPNYGLQEFTGEEAEGELD